MKKLIIITGDLATGKTRYSQILSQKYNIICLNKDTIKEILGDDIGFKNREENLKLSKATFDIMKYVFENSAKNDCDMILEANFHTPEIAVLEMLCVKYNYSAMMIILTSPIPIIHQRYLNRINNENRHLVHKAIDMTDIDVFQDYIIRGRNQKTFGEIIEISISDFSYQNDNIIFDKIDNFLIYKKDC